jgi:hypothetical protein
MSETIPPPTLIAFVVCDSIYFDGTGKQALVGLFDQIRAAEFPAVHSRFCVIVMMTSLRPNTQCKLEIVNSAEEEIVAMEGKITGDTPRTIYQVIFEFTSVTFPSDGQYMIRFIANGHTIGQRPIDLIRMEPTDDPQ